MKYVVVHIIKNRVAGFAKCKSKKEVIEFAHRVQRYVGPGVYIWMDFLWANRYHRLTDQSCLEIL